MLPCLQHLQAWPHTVLCCTGPGRRGCSRLSTAGGLSSHPASRHAQACCQGKACRQGQACCQGQGRRCAQGEEGEEASRQERLHGAQLPAYLWLQHAFSCSSVLLCSTSWPLSAHASRRSTLRPALAHWRSSLVLRRGSECCCFCWLMLHLQAGTLTLAGLQWKALSADDKQPYEQQHGAHLHLLLLSKAACPPSCSCSVLCDSWDKQMPLKRSCTPADAAAEPACRASKDAS